MQADGIKKVSRLKKTAWPDATSGNSSQYRCDPYPLAGISMPFHCQRGWPC